MDVTRNREAELAALGAALSNQRCAAQLAALPEDAFSAPDTAAAHRAVKRLIAKGFVPDLVTMDEEMRQDVPEPAEMLLEGLQSCFPSLYSQYEALIMEARKRRIILHTAMELTRSAVDPGEAPDKLISEAVSTLTCTQSSMGSVDMRHALGALMESVDENKKGRCMTGISGLDRLTGGFRGGKLIVLGARPGVGKTALGLAIAANVARQTGPVLIVSLEMDEAEITARLAAAVSGVDVQKIESDSMTQEEWDKFSPALGELNPLPIRIATRATTPLQIRREAVSMQNRGGLAMIMVDYIQLMRADGRCVSRYEEVSAISRELKRIAMDLGVPVLALTQFNRNSETSLGAKLEKRKPQMSEARESGSIEQDANLFIVQWAPPSPAEPGKGEHDRLCRENGWEWQVLSVDKNRQGCTGKISVGFDKPHMRFHSLG